MIIFKLHLKFVTLLVFVLLLASCTDSELPIKSDSIANQKQFVATMQKHLDAVSSKNLQALAATMSPDGEMQLILPSTPIINTVDSFLKFHEEWFVDSTWTFETKILNTTIEEDLGIAITEVIYREPERDGKPYFNKMIVSYALKKKNAAWYIIKDHASSIQKSTD